MHASTLRKGLFIAILVAVGSGAKADEPTPVARIIHIATVHLDGNASTRGGGGHPPEPFPEAALPRGGGLSLSGPTDDGAWRVRMFAFEPSQIVAFEGETLRLVFVGVQGPEHRVQVGDGPVLTVRRGSTTEAVVRAEAVGAIPFVSLDREPSMRGTILVVPRATR
jgi:hypothetical protein